MWHQVMFGSLVLKIFSQAIGVARSSLLSGIFLLLTCLSCGPVQAQDVPDIDLSQAPKPSPNLPQIGTGGEYTTSVKVELPKFRDFPVNVSLNYSSSNTSRSGVDNVVAFGWSLNAYSVIERKALGGGVPTFDDGQDLYLLDGSELMACGSWSNAWTRHYPLRYVTDTPSGSCSARGNFVSRVDDHNRVVFDQATNRFIVTHPDGLRYTYTSIGDLEAGAAPAGALEAAYYRSGRWLLTEIADQQTQSNKVTYQYSFGAMTDGYPYTISSISYAGYRVEFNYAAYSQAAIPKFATGSSLRGRQPKQLRSIIIKDGSTVLRGYQLTNALTSLTNTSLLTKVQERGSDLVVTGIDITSGTSLPADTFTYSADTTSFAAKTYPGVQFHEGTIALDWDLNGSDDLYISPAQIYYLKHFGGDNGYDAASIGYSFQSGAYKFDAGRNLLALANVTPITCKNTNSGDSVKFSFHRQETPKILGSGNGSASHNCWSNNIYRWHNTNNEFTNQTFSAVDMATGQVKYALTMGQDTSYHVGNFDLDGDYELVRGRYYQFLWDIGDSSADGPFGGSDNAAAKLSSGVDFTGDGVQDNIYKSYFHRLVPEHSYLGETLVKRIQYASIPISASQNPNYLFRPVSWPTGSVAADLIGYGDVDGNGLSDVVYQKHNLASADQLVILPANGIGFGVAQTFALLDQNLTPMNLLAHERSFEPQPMAWGRYGPDFVNQRSAIRDINGDGRVDLIIHTGFVPTNEGYPTDIGGTGSNIDSYVSGKSWIFLNNGSAFVLVPTIGGTAGFEGLVATGDFDGDGLVDIAREGADGSILFGNGGIPSRMTSETTTSGAKIEIAYTSSSTFAGNNLPAAVQVVDHITTTACPGSTSTSMSCSGTPSTVSYTYVGGSYDYTNRMPLGFRTVAAHYPAVGAEVEGPIVTSVYKNTSIADRGLLVSQTTTQNGVAYARTFNTWDVSYSGNGPYSADKSSERVATRYGSGLVETRKDYTYSPYGEVTQIWDYGFTNPADGSDLNPADTTTTVYNYIPALGPYIVNKVSAKGTVRGTVWSSDQSTWLREEHFNYDGHGVDVAPTEGNLTSTYRWRQTGVAEVRTWAAVGGSAGYDDWGNLLKEADAKGYQTTYEYDAEQHLFRTKVTNALSQVTETTTWDAGCQAPATSTDINGLDTTFTYDSFCRETNRDLPGGQYVSTLYMNFGNAGTQYVRTAQPSAALSGGAVVPAYSWQYFDGLGRTYKTMQSSSAGNLQTLTDYDERGQVTSKSNALTAAELAAITAGTATADLTSFEYDPLGRPTKVTNPDGTYETTGYGQGTYGSFGVSNLGLAVVHRDAHCYDATTANTICGKTVQVSDAWGHKTHDIVYRNDPADLNGDPPYAHVTTYLYDLSGHLVKIGDPVGQIWLYGYDTFGNRTSASDPGLGQGTLTDPPALPSTSLDSPDVGPWTMEHDANNNLIRQTDAKGQVIQFAYDALNRVRIKDVITPEGTARTAYTYDGAVAGYYNLGKLTTQYTSKPAASSGPWTYHSFIYNDYTESGQIARQRNRVESQWFNFTYTYAADGKSVIGMNIPTTPGDTAVTRATDDIAQFTYYVDGRLRTFRNADATTTYISSTVYDKWGNTLSTLYGSGARDDALYDPLRGWPTVMTSTEKGGLASGILRNTYDCSATGRIVSGVPITP